MIQRIKEVLLTQYIGAIVVGFLTVAAIGDIIGLVVNPLAFYVNMKTRRPSGFGPAPPSSIPWENYMPDVVALLLRVLVIWLLLRWLYVPRSTSAPETESEPEGSNDATA